MARIIDKIILFILGTLLLLNVEDSATQVIVFLVALTLSALPLCINDKRVIAVLLLIYMGLCFWNPAFTVYLATLFYDSLWFSQWWGFAGVIFYIINWNYLGYREGIVLWIFTGVLGLLLSQRTKDHKNLKQEYIRLQDTSTELNLVMQQRNKELLEKQDSEVYLATLQERNRIAREIHDNVGHMLSRSILQLGALTTIHKEEPVHSQLVSVNDTLNQAMNNIRESVHDLHDDSVDLKQAICEATEEMNDKYKVTIDYDMSSGIPKNIKYSYIAIIKEAMSNIIKHSNADKVVIMVREHPAFYQMSIEDNGTNCKEPAGEITVAEGSGQGIGLSNMRERIEALHGSIHFRNEQGFRIFISVPKQKNESRGKL